MPRILIIDDERAMRSLLRQTLERAGHEVEEAANGAEGMTLYHAHPADLVITDLVMPDQEGLETIMKLRREHARVRIIAISGGGRGGAQDYLQMARKLGAHCTLSKPFTRDEILEAVRSAMAG